MNLHPTGSDEICLAMGLGQFIEPQWTSNAQPALRIVLSPSFHPDLCLTFVTKGESCSVSVVALLETRWSHQGSLYCPSAKEAANIDDAAFTDLRSQFAATAETFDKDQKCIILDEMGSELCLVSAQSTVRIEANVSAHLGVQKLVSKALEISWSACREARVRNAIADAGQYVGLRIVKVPVPPVPPVTRIAILGADTERHEFLEMLRKKRDESSKAKPDGC